MRTTATNGSETCIPDFCPYCSLDTAGNHEVGCPNTPIYYPKVYYYSEVDCKVTLIADEGYVTWVYQLETVEEA